MYVIGTAGHVDHGKSTLVKALTGIDPDRLQEEKEREMTIDLGFAWLRLPSGREVSIVDVPGHERFIKNMLAGVGGVDAALLVIAADEGPMPQTAEHLAILDLLQVDRGIVVLTKRDLVDDEWLGLVEEEVREELAHTSLAGAPLVAVSARTGAGLDVLKHEIDRVLDSTAPPPDRGRPRLGIDRVFSVAGFGTVVTGTLIDGALAVGQEVVILPHGQRTRIRGLQSHKHKVETATPGSRVAVNLTGLAVTDLQRGQVLALPGALAVTTKIDARLTWLADAPKPLVQNALLDFFTGAAETTCRVTLLDAETLAPGQRGWVQLRLAAPVAVARGDRFILRQASPSRTMGGGVVVDPQARRHRRFATEILSKLATLEQGTPAELVLAALGAGALEVKAALEKTARPAEVARPALDALLAGGEVVRLGAPDAAGPVQTNQLIMSRAGWAALLAQMRAILAGYHAQYPLRRGMSKEELKSRLGLTPRIYNAALARATGLAQAVEEGATLRLPEHAVIFRGAAAEQVARLQAAQTASLYSPPAPAELGIDAEVVSALIERGELVKISDDIFYPRAAYDTMVARILALIDERGNAAVADLRDLFGTSRKYAVPFMEHLDEARLTRRQGDVRVRW